MIRDIVFEQMYAKKIESHVQQVGQQAFMSGRQQGWNDILFILNELESKNLETSQELIVQHLQQLLQGKAESSSVQENTKKEDTPIVKKSGLTLVK